ncbi:MAG: fatty acid desaturase [Acidimicrobiales bacterium]|nr:fatty acid desaturase [Acidimicrobiales bacterium]
MPPVLPGVLAGLLACQVAFFLTTIYLHRALAHRAMTLSPWLTWVFRVAIWVTTGIRPRQWVAVHRKHHAYTDVEGDPHSPVLEGFLTVQLGNTFLYRRVARNQATVTRYARDLPPDRWDRLLFDHAIIGLGIGYLILALALGFRLALVAAAVHATAYLLGSGAINAVGHRFGRRPYDNQAGNSQWLALLVAGEGLHNNHHAAPTSARLALGRGELDPGWWLVRFMLWRRWAEVRLTEPRRRPGGPATEAARSAVGV